MFHAWFSEDTGELLLQKRCSDKILFPEHWANTCCSHPLAEGALFLGEAVIGESDGSMLHVACCKLHAASSHAQHGCTTRLSQTIKPHY